jgi:hypothetical protein
MKKKALTSLGKKKNKNKNPPVPSHKLASTVLTILVYAAPRVQYKFWKAAETAKRGRYPVLH